MARAHTVSKLFPLGQSAHHQPLEMPWFTLEASGPTRRGRGFLTHLQAGLHRPGMPLEAVVVRAAFLPGDTVLLAQGHRSSPQRDFHCGSIVWMVVSSMQSLRPGPSPGLSSSGQRQCPEGGH